MSENPIPNPDFKKTKREFSDAISSVIDILDAQSNNFSDIETTPLDSVTPLIETKQNFSLFDLTEIESSQPLLTLLSEDITQAIQKYEHITQRDTNTNLTYYPRILIINEAFSDGLLKDSPDEWIVNIPQYYSVVISPTRLRHLLDKATTENDIARIHEQITLSFCDYLIKVNTAHSILDSNRFRFGDSETISELPLRESFGDIRNECYPTEGTLIYGVVAKRNKNLNDNKSDRNRFEEISYPTFPPVLSWLDKLHELSLINNPNHIKVKQNATFFLRITNKNIDINSYSIAVPIFISRDKSSQQLPMIDVDQDSKSIITLIPTDNINNEDIQIMNILSMLTYLNPEIIKVFRRFITTGTSLTEACKQSEIHEELKQFTTRYERILNIPFPDKRRRALNTLHKDVTQRVQQKLRKSSTS